MPDLLLRQIALLSESNHIGSNDVAKVSAALQKQAARDLVQFWDVKATVDTFPTLEDVPIGYWPIMVMDDINTPGAAGVHEDKNGQPFALVTASDQIDDWSLTASHEMIEMLLDPFGNRLIPGDSPKSDQGRVEILLEACDPSEAKEFAYTINGVLVSDFYSPRFFDPVAAPGVRYSFTGALQEPRQVLRGGYLSWHDLASDEWWQEIWFDDNGPSFRNLGRMSAQNGSLRSQIDAKTQIPVQFSNLQAAKAAGLRTARVDEAAGCRATALREQIAMLTGGAAAQSNESFAIAKNGGTDARPRAQLRGRRPMVQNLRRAPSLN